MPTYRIIRFYRSGARRTILRGLSLAEARAHCQDPRTSAAKWFDGYEEEK